MAADYTHFIPDQQKPSEVCTTAACGHNDALEFSTNPKDRL
jgi:hypothetical protein